MIVGILVGVVVGTSCLPLKPSYRCQMAFVGAAVEKVAVEEVDVGDCIVGRGRVGLVGVVSVVDLTVDLVVGVCFVVDSSLPNLRTLT